MKLLRDPQLTQLDWDSAMQGIEDYDFLQSFGWGEFHTAMQHPIWRLAVEDEGTIIAQLLVIQLSLGYGQTLLYSPHGNLINKHLSLPKLEAATKLLLEEVKNIGQETGAICFRIDPLIPVGDLPSKRYYLTRGFIANARKHVQPKHTVLLDLTQPLSQLSAAMKPKTRYNIALAEKKDIEVSIDNSPEALQEFLNILRETSERNKFHLHPSEYYLTQQRILSRYELQDLYIAHYEGSAIAAILINKFNGRATYVHGASSSAHRELMAPHLLHFHAIKELKSEGFRTYDLGGIHPDPDHPWAGITRFKRGFGGREIEYVGTLELPLKPFAYRLYSFIQRFR